jgi:DNA-3-methyladenine glycosylase
MFMVAIVTQLPRAFYARDAAAVAQDLIGMQLAVRRSGGLAVGRIVEVEAYQGPEDRAAHSAGGRRTARTEVMFGAPGHAYVYLVYGMWRCLNVVTAAAGVPHAVLLRALEPVCGFDTPSWGPGLLCRALGIDRADNGEDLCDPDLAARRMWIQAPRQPGAVRVSRSARIGVDYAGHWARRKWRFFDRTSAYVSTVSMAARRAALARRAPVQIQV